MQVSDGDNVEKMLEQIEDVDCMHVVGAHCDDGNLKDIDDLDCMHTLDGDCVQVLDAHVQPDEDEGLVKNL